MSHLKRSVQVVGALAAACTGAFVPGPPVSAATEAGHLVWVVEDQTGGLYYNVKTGERFDVASLQFVPNLGIAAVQAASGLVLSTDGQLFAPLGQTSEGTPGESVVTVGETTGVGTFVDAADETQWVLVDERSTVPAVNEFALKLADGTILTVANHVLIPVQSATGLTP